MYDFLYGQLVSYVQVAATYFLCPMNKLFQEQLVSYVQVVILLFLSRYNFLQGHLHWGSTECTGSEHTINSVQYSAELHLVHWNAKVQQHRIWKIF